ncbi:MAG TPA: DMT family transporter [Vitreimonas sp.]|jgi:transporter family-2 protein|nr:DMT family transporter [Vitreimonas sp.]
MNTQTPLYIALSLLGGVLIPITAALSGAMGRSLGNPNMAAFITVAGAFLLVLAYSLATGTTGGVSLAAIAKVPVLQLLAGLGIAFYIVSITYVGPRFGVGNAIMLVVAAQIASSAAIDQFGLFGAPQKPLDAMRAIGLVVMVIGVVIAQYAAAHAKPVSH